MNILTASVIIISAVLIMMGCCILFIKIFGRGMFFGITITSAIVIKESDNPEAILCNAVDSLGSEFEYSGSVLLIIDGGMDRIQRETCEKFCSRYPYMEMCSPDLIRDRVLELQGTEIRRQ